MAEEEGVGAAPAEAARRGWRARFGQAKATVNDWRKLRAEKRAADQEEKERIAADRASSVYVLPAGYVRAAHAIAWIATCGVLYFLWLYCVDEAKDVTMAMELSRAGNWQGAFEFHFPLLLGFVAVSLAVAICCKYWISIYVSLSYKRPGEGWPKFWALVLGLLTSLVVVLGSFSVMQGGRIEGHREEVVVEQQATSQRRALEAQLVIINQDLREALGPEDIVRPSTQMQACRNTAETWQVRIANTPRSDPQYAAIARAISDAILCDELRAQRAQKVAEIAALPVDAQVQGRVVAARDADIAAAVDGARNVRSVVLVVTADLLAILFSWVGLRLDRVRQRQLAEARKARLEEHREQADAADDAALAAAAILADAPASAGQSEPPPNSEPEPETLDLPPLPDLRGQIDPDFEGLQTAVDEEGRVLKRFSGWRATPRAKSDARRAPEDAEAPAAPVEPEAANEDDDVGDWLRRQARTAAE